ncbi:MAG TPA: carboxyl transferase domain-containing protein, partial [Actinomycetaceae bacterium]|nr:carboxyl transferase domain-containing protein [Actinomycetaceae bacterium]
MPILTSAADPASEEFSSNEAAQRALATELDQRLAQVARGGTERSRTRHIERGKLLPRERIRVLLDAGSPFLELAPLAAWELYEGECPGAGVIAGIGTVAGRQVMVV